MAEILWIRRKTLINLSINHTRYKYFVQQNKIYYILLHPVCHPLDNLPRETMLAWLAFRPLVHVSIMAEWLSGIHAFPTLKNRQNSDTNTREGNFLKCRI